MTIRTQLMLLMVPLFAGVAVVISALNYAVQMRELRWALTEEASSVAVAAAEFVRADLLTGRQEATGATIEQRFRAILDRGAARRLALVTRDNRILCEVAAPASALPAAPRVSDETWTALAESYVVGSPSFAGNDQLYLLAWAPVMGSTTGSTSVAGVVIAEISAEPVRERRTLILHGGAKLVGSAALLGLLAAMAIGEFLARRIRMLSHMAASLETRPLSATAEEGVIREINELAGTFNTVNSVFRDIIAKSTRARLDGGQFRGEAEAARSFATRFFPSTSVRSGRTVLASTPTGATAAGRFATTWKEGTTAWGLLLGLQPEETLENVTRASACVTYVREALKTCTPEQVLEEAAALFEVRRSDLLRLSPDGQSCEHWNVEAGRINHRQIPCRGSIFVGDVQGATDGRLQALAALYESLAPEARMAEVRTGLGDEAVGALLYVGMDTSTV